MKNFFLPDLTIKGRLLRGGVALLLFIAAFRFFSESMWLSAGLAFSGSFILLEALTGWCVVRACGIKTRI